MVRVTELVAEMNVSEMTIRRDLAVLEKRELIERIHGGGVLRSSLTGRLNTSRGLDPTLDVWQDDAGTPNEATDIAPANELLEAHVGIVVPSDHYYFPPVIAGARQVLDANAVRRVLAISRYQAHQDQTLVRQLLEMGSTGLLLTPNVKLGESDEDKIGWLFESPVPTVLIERTIRSPDGCTSLSSVRTDHEFGCELAVRHLRGLGHRGVALVTHGLSQSGTRVINGWRQAIETCALASDLSPLIVDKRADTWPADEAMHEIFETLKTAGVTALIAQGDRLALALAHHARMRGWQIPRDLSVVSYDDELAEMADPPLTAVAPPKEALGRTAAELLLRMLADGRTDAVRHVVVEPHLVVRSSTSEPRTGGLA